MKTSFTFLLPLLIQSAFGEFRQEKTDSSLKLFDGETLITEYRTDHHLPYLYPLVGPTGTSLTRHFPMKKDVAGEEKDHPHHRSFWFTHGDVNGHDFWHSRDHNSNIVHKSFADAKAGSFTVNLEWQHEKEVLLKEKRTYQFAKQDDKSLTITVTSALTAVTDVTFGDTKEGSFALRLTPTLRHEGKIAKGHIANSEGKLDKDAWGKRARWVSYHGPDSSGKKVVVTMMDHPSNHNHPTHWHARTYGLLTANPWGEKSFTKKGDSTHLLKKSQTLTQKYALLLQSGDFNKATIESSYKSFSK
ncbi:MAG: hypothetical protein ACJAQT_002137 [Akkermansiaceae bacterium]|jgi:hypothetical protein